MSDWMILVVIILYMLIGTFVGTRFFSLILCSASGDDENVVSFFVGVVWPLSLMIEFVLIPVVAVLHKIKVWISLLFLIKRLIYPIIAPFRLMIYLGKKYK